MAIRETVCSRTNCVSFGLSWVDEPHDQGVKHLHRVVFHRMEEIDGGTSI